MNLTKGAPYRRALAELHTRESRVQQLVLREETLLGVYIKKMYSYLYYCGTDWVRVYTELR